MREIWNLFKPKLSAAKMSMLLSVWICCLFYLLFQGGKTSIMLFVMVTLFGLYLLFGGLNGIGRARGERHFSGEFGEWGGILHAGDQIRVRLKLEIPGFLPLPYVIVRETLKRHSGETWSFEESLVPNMNGRGELLFQTPPLERGRYAFSDTECVTEDIFGLIEHRGSFSARGEFRVLPRTAYIAKWQLFDRKNRLLGPQSVGNLSGRETNQVSGVRDYVYGDRISRIHWNATARTGEWKSKEFEYESIPKTMIVLDTFEAHYRSARQFETAVSTAASLLEYGGREMVPIGLCSLGQADRVFEPVQGRGRLHEMMDHLVDLDPRGSGSLLGGIQSVLGRLPKGAVLVVVTPLSGGPVLDLVRFSQTHQMSFCHIQIAEGAVSGADGSPAERQWTDSLRAKGVAAYRAGSLDELPAVLEGGIR
ncbi:DUF58 domain-containing protein [Saccharibacillus sp. CPCC 101409]|uniref:DUF58 domain-containing protein n=1 Tax=Saccharibacillus sp. CPCC 101409 TaxID=3058041 RepID=UPI002672D165|nr:DUF58 domain-containing protein [Saccharibacillus sp. CPCC 101409]MDO3409080.1 DUF58 domain-containing protein [Saccharibacillus sp. CPCC 101409]